MRILSIRFKNLNSLTGEWEIDLTHPTFASEGIFAITGPTGAGKSTILDAICLALYGRTPRLKKVTDSENEIMSRQTGECFSEVVFETQKGRFRCHWSQRRSFKKAEEKLQTPRREIADVDSGEVLEAKIKDVAGKVEECTGMDFQRFTRSMLLAQGGFAAFLEAGPDERGPILEDITGTEIYSEISMRVHERKSEEQNKLDVLQADLKGVQVLEGEEEDALRKSLETMLKEEEELFKRIKGKNLALQWQDGIARLEAELKRAGMQEEELKRRADAFSPEEEKLKRALQALELAEDYSSLYALRNEDRKEREDLSARKELYPACEQKEKEAKALFKKEQELLLAKKEEQKAARPLIRKVVGLDSQIREKKEPLNVLKENCAAAEQAFRDLQEKQKADSAALALKLQSLAALQEKLAETQADQELVEQFTSICVQVDALKRVHAQGEGKLKESREQKDRLQKLADLWTQQCALHEKLQREWIEKKKELEKREAALLSLLNGKELSGWRGSLQSLRDSRQLLREAIEKAGALEQLKNALVQLEKEKERRISDKAALSVKFQELSVLQAGLEKERDLLDGQIALLHKIESLEAARRQLQNGEPCPLCGSLEHPFAEEGCLPVKEEAEERLEEVKKSLESVGKEISALKVREGKLEADLEYNSAEQKNGQGKIKQFEAYVDSVCVRFALDSASSDLKGEIDALHAKHGVEIDAAAQIIERAEQIEAALAVQRQLIDRARNDLENASREKIKAETEKKHAVCNVERLDKEAACLSEQEGTAVALLRESLKSYALVQVSLQDLDQVVAKLKERRDAWLLREKEKSECEEKRNALEAQIRQKEEQLQRLAGDLEKWQAQFEAKSKELNDLQKERCSLFGNKAPDQEELRLSFVVEESARRFEECRSRHSDAAQQVHQIKARMDQLEQSLAERKERLKADEKRFQKRFHAAGFAEEEDYLKARLGEAERRSLEEKRQKIAFEKAALASKKQEVSRRLDEERKKRLTTQAREMLEGELAQLDGRLKELQQAVGGMSQTLKENERLKEKQQDKAQAVQAQKIECSRWGMLHHLIGSKDGKKYRNFAQSLTFEMMVMHANRQLQKMTDRYLLKLADNKHLELSVVDNYQAGEVRSTKNLSGGESFLVSLSLSLGLSHMSSKNVRVDSLFLDEGFGTLDDEALDTALETLGGLQQEGKLIGVISHVPALKERICTQIQVVPRVAGRSVLLGPGCHRGDGSESLNLS